MNLCAPASLKLISTRKDLANSYRSNASRFCRGRKKVMSRCGIWFLSGVTAPLLSSRDENSRNGGGIVDIVSSCPTACLFVAVNLFPPFITFFDWQKLNLSEMSRVHSIWPLFTFSSHSKILTKEGEEGQTHSNIHSSHNLEAMPLATTVANFAIGEEGGREGGEAPCHLNN